MAEQTCNTCRYGPPDYSRQPCVGCFWSLSENKPTAWCGPVGPNLQKLRVMSAAQLAELFTSVEFLGSRGFSCPVDHPCPEDGDCRSCFREWLEQEAV